jgi:hypothetical protein
VLRLTEHMAANFNKKAYTEIIFLDVSKAYCTAWTAGLAHKLRTARIQDSTALLLLCVIVRKFRVKMEGHFSEWKPMRVSQDPVLTPLLWSIYIATCRPISGQRPKYAHSTIEPASQEVFSTEECRVCVETITYWTDVQIFIVVVRYTQANLKKWSWLDDNKILLRVIITHTLHHHYIPPPTLNIKVKVTLRRTVSQSVSLGVKPHLGLMTRYLLLFDSCGLVFVRRPLWREDGSVFCICCWPSPA